MCQGPGALHKIRVKVKRMQLWASLLGFISQIQDPISQLPKCEVQSSAGPQEQTSMYQLSQVPNAMQRVSETQIPLPSAECSDKTGVR